jgi:hypothetical protein
MALSAFDDKQQPPSPGDLEAMLAKSARHWTRIVDAISENYPPIEQAWNFSGAKYGWSLRLKQKDRIVLYLIPQARQFLAGVVLGEKAVKAARAAKIPAEVIALIDAAPVYAEGRGIRFPVTSAEDVRACLALTSLKMAK